MSNKQDRVQKLISNYGPYSRRQVDRLIAEGKVKVNGEIITLGTKASVNDKIEINGETIKFNLRHEYYLVNKPKGYICSREDKMGKEVISLIPNYKNRNLFTVGRLDVNTTGLIIVTTDGSFANKLSSPSNKIKKTYLVWVKNQVSKENLIKLQKGIELDDGYITKPLSKLKIISNKDQNVLLKLVLIEGKKNQIRRMFKAINNEVINLKRIEIGNYKLDDLKLGDFKKTKIIL